MILKCYSFQIQSGCKPSKVLEFRKNKKFVLIILKIHVFNQITFDCKTIYTLF